MAYMHKKIATSTAILGAFSLVASSVAWFWGEGIINSLWPEEAEAKVVSSPAVKAVVEEDPREPVPEPPKPEPKKHVQIRKPEKVRDEKKTENKQKTLQEKWLEKANEGGMYAFGNDNGYSGAGSGGENECQLLQPVRVRAMIADTSSTDAPGLSWGAMSEDVQGVYADGTPCIAIHAMAVVSFDVQKAGDYATNKAPVQVGEIWMQDGFSIKVDQPGKHIDGSIGVVGVADHHTLSKTLAGIGSVLFGLANNASRAFSVNSTEVTNPVQDTMRKKLERPSTISFTGGKAIEFQVMPVSTPGYENL